MINPEVKKNIGRMLNVFENDSGSPETDYTTIYLYHDGNGGRKQVTLGRGFTDDGGNLKKVVQLYIDKGGQYADQLDDYIAQFGRGTLCNNRDFLNILVQAGKNDQLMRDAQDEVFDERYYNPALKWFTDNGFTLNLSLAVIVDSYLHSGGILGFLRNAFQESVPSNGGDEKKWISEYINARKAWLIRKGKPLSNTVYRPNFFIAQMNKDNWDFNCPLVPNDVKIC